MIVVAGSSAFFTYRVVSNKYELEIAKKDKQLAETELVLEKEKAKKQENIFVSATTALNTLNSEIDAAKNKANKLKSTLNGVVVVSADCKPTKEFLEIWNSVK